jgi:hypothetical protein
MYSATGFRTHMENKIAGLFYFFWFHSRGTAKEEEEEEKNMETLIQGSVRTVTDRHTKTTGRVCVCAVTARAERGSSTKRKYVVCFFLCFKISKTSVGLWLLFLRENRLRMEQQSGWK